MCWNILTHTHMHTHSQARAYFNSLSAKKTPVRGTQGERYRQKQLIRQLPAYDVDTFYCNERTEDEMKQMELFIRLRKERFLGRGAIKMRDTSDKSSQWVRWFQKCFCMYVCNVSIVEYILFTHSLSLSLSFIHAYTHTLTPPTPTPTPSHPHPQTHAHLLYRSLTSIPTFLSLIFRYVKVARCLSKLETLVYLPSGLVQIAAGTRPASPVQTAVSYLSIWSTSTTRETVRSTVEDTTPKNWNLDVQLVMRWIVNIV